MYKSKRFSYSYEETTDEGKSASTMIEDIMKDPEFPQLEEIVIGCWGEVWDDEKGAQTLVDGIVANKNEFAHIKSLFIGDMDYEDCEVSWIIQADYSALWEAMPQLEKLVIKGSSGLSLGTVKHDKLEDLEIICGGLPTTVIEAVQKAELPSLKKLLLYVGVDEYGFDGNLSTIKTLLDKSNFSKLEYLGITDSEIQDEITEAVLACKYMGQIQTLDLSLGTLTDKGGQMLLDQIGNYPNIQMLDLHYHYLSDDMMNKLKGLNLSVNVDEQEKPYVFSDGEISYYPMLTE